MLKTISRENHRSQSSLHIKENQKNFKPEQAKIILEKPKNFLSGRPKLGPTNDDIFSGFVLILARLSVVPQVDSQE